MSEKQSDQQKLDTATKLIIYPLLFAFGCLFAAIPFRVALWIIGV